MSESDTRSVSQIRRETEQTRAALITTVEELRGTVSDTATDIKSRLRPDAIKAEVSRYIRSRGEQLFHDVKEAARRNPMQAIAVGASVAYPAMRMARAIPLPILMIGAGLFLAGSKTGQDLTQKASDLAADATEEARRRVDDLRSQASELGHQAAQAVADVRDQATQAAPGVRDHAARAVSDVRDLTANALDRGGDNISGTARRVSDQVNQLADQTTQVANRSANAAQETTSQVTDSLRDAQTRATEAGRELFDAARERLTAAGENLSHARRKTANTIRDSIQQNPLLLAGVGLLVGGLIASALPKSETEQGLLGDASDTVKRRARQAAAAGFESAKGATGEILANMAQQASAEGLSPEGLAQGAQDVTQRLQRVADRAVTTAFDPDQHRENHQQTEGTGGGEQNG
jgi:hypothetical protein